MSLLLDALRRAEQDSKKRKLADAEMPAAAPDSALPEAAVAATSGAPAAELTLEAQSPAPAAEPVLAASPPAVDKAGFGGGPPAPDASFLDFELPAEDAPLPEAVVPAALAPRKASQPYGRYDRPAWEDSSSNWGTLTANPLLPKKPGSGDAGASGPVPIKPATRKAAEITPERSVFARPADGGGQKPSANEPGPALTLSATTPRQALSAAGVMAGRKTMAPKPGKERRRQVLAVVALLLALPVMAFLLFGEAMFGSSSGLVKVAAPAFPVPVAVSPAVTESGPAALAAPASAAPALGPTAMVAAVPASPPPQVVAAPRVAPANAPASMTPPARTRAPRSAPARTAGLTSAGVTPAATAAGPSRPASLMDAAYAAYQAGNTSEAARLYREVLKADATQRDAWLGLAVIAHASNQPEPAMDAYRRVLRLEPQNATALAGVSSLSRAAGGPQQESRLRELLARSPQEADLNHALALVLSGEQRWSEAQPLFFKAHALAPREPQFAYNLAVALDHMRKSSLAAQYYETALGLAQGKAAGFDETHARTRLAALRVAR